MQDRCDPLMGLPHSPAHDDLPILSAITEAWTLQFYIFSHPLFCFL